VAAIVIWFSPAMRKELFPSDMTKLKAVTSE
jgi:hypothetical protein